MADIPLVSVVMSVYNGARYLAPAIDSILCQSFENFEFLIIDDGSTDGSRAIVESYEDPRIRLVINHGNLGLPVSLNNGIRLAKGKYVARQDADDISLPTRLEEQKEFAERTPDCALVGCSWELIDKEGSGFGNMTSPCEHSQILEGLIPNRLKFPHGCYFIRKDALHAVGGYDERFFYTQDYDLLLRISKEFRFGAVPSVLYKLRALPWRTNFKILCQAQYRRIAQERYANCYGPADVPTISELRSLLANDIKTYSFSESRYWFSLCLHAWRLGERSQTAKYMAKCVLALMTRRENDQL